MADAQIIVRDNKAIVVPFGADLLAPMVAAAANSAAQVAAAVATIVPQATAVTTSNTSSGTVYTLNIGGAPFTDGAFFDFYPPDGNLGPVQVKVGSNTLTVYDLNQNNLPAGALPQKSLVRIRLNLSAARFNLFNVLPTKVATDDAANAAAGARGVVEGLYKTPLALPINNNPNNLVFTSAPQPGNQTDFSVLITATNTGQTFINANGRSMRVTKPGGADVVAGDLTAGYVVSLHRSDEGGGIAYINSATSASLPGVPVGNQDGNILYNPYGAVAINSGTVSVTPINRYFAVIGSSNAATTQVADGSRPDQMIKAALDDYFPGSGLNFVAELQATQGTAWDNNGTQLNKCTQFMAGNSEWVFPYFWMNDCRTIYYNDGGGFPFQLNAMLGAIDYIRSKGAEPVLSTGFHPDPRAGPDSASTGKALDPFYFSDTRAYPDGGSGRSMVWPVFKASPVSPTADMVPSANVSDGSLPGFMMFRDWTGGGVQRTGYARVWHFNRTIRYAAALKNCVLMDLERSTYRLCIEPIADKGSGLSTYYNINDPLHPYAAFYQTGIKPVIQEWARAQAEGRTDIRVFRGY
jgi:hypothetical protein